MYDPKIVQDVDNSYFNLIFFFVILLILTFFVYVSFVISTRQSDKIQISKADYALFENNSHKPDLLFSDTETVNQSKKLDYSKIYDFAQIRFCPVGKCVVDINNGFKRCPEDNTTALTYFPEIEGCTGADVCEDTRVPYAVNNNDGANKNICEKDTICRCIATPQCDANLVSTFDITGGNPYSTDPRQQNYSFNNNTYNDFYIDDLPIVIPEDNLGRVFCHLNPAYTDRVKNGCDFTNSIYDPLECQKSNLFQNLEDDTGDVIVIPSNFTRFTDGNLTAGVVPTSFTGYGKGRQNIWVTFANGQPDLDDQGFFTFTDPIYGIEYIIYYDGFVENNVILYWKITSEDDVVPDSNETITIYQLLNIKGKLKNNGTWSTGLPIKISAPLNGSINTTSGSLKLEKQIIRYQPCITSTAGPNYKNMLLCTQDNNQVCSNGIMAYNIDQLLGDNTSITNQENSRSFCQASGTDRLDFNKVKDFYLNDPAYFTIGCVKGSGCGGIIDNTLCTEEGDCKAAVERKKDIFFSNYDESAVKSVWSIYYQSEKDSKRFGFSDIGASMKLDVINPDSSMFEIETGDYWSINAPTLFKYLKVDTVKGNTKLFLNSINDIHIDSSISYDGVSDVFPSISGICSADKSITIDPGINIDLPINETISILGESGKNFGIIGRSKNGIYLTSIEGKLLNEDTDLIQLLKQKGINIYKQFGFNGINYNTSYQVDSGNPVRYYSDSFIYSDLLNNPLKTRPVVDYISLVDEVQNNLNISSSEQAFNDNNAVFKNNNSMYYPVWNNATYKQECIMCKPAFFAYTSLSEDNRVNGINIQFSGKHFNNYVYDVDKDDFIYTTFTKIKSSGSNTNYLIMEDLNNNISVGDFIIDGPGLLTRNFKKTTQSSVNNYPTLNGLYYDSIIKDILVPTITPVDSDKIFILVDKLGKSHRFQPQLGTDISSIGNDIYTSSYFKPPVNYFMGKKYIDTENNTYEVFPVVQVIDILQIEDKNVLITNAGININYNEDFFIQTIKRDENLQLVIQQDFTEQQEAVGKGAAAKVDQISEGRITNTKLTNQGSNYSVENRPGILLSKYYLGEEINNLI